MPTDTLPAPAFVRDGNWKKLRPEDVAEIQLRMEAGERPAALARDYGVRQGIIKYHAGKELPKFISPYAKALTGAADARRKGNWVEAARLLRLAADAVAK